jgi:type VI secretion system secreted protein VgrG
VTLRKRDYTRNVLRTPANNKLRMEDNRGEEHVKLSTEHSGKSQLNLGHLVDAQKQKRGEGFELRSDGHGAIRAGKGLFISADKQPKAQGDMLDMNEALAQLNNALQLVSSLTESAIASGALPADMQSQQGLKEALVRLKEAGMIASAPAGIALTTPANIQLSAEQTLAVTAGESLDISARKSLRAVAGEAISLFASKLGLKLFAARGAVDIQAQSDVMSLLADKGLTITSVNGELILNAQNGITLLSRGVFVKLKDGIINWGASASLEEALAAVVPQDPVFTDPMHAGFQLKDKTNGQPVPYQAYEIEAADGSVVRGVTDENGYTQQHHGINPQNIRLSLE